MKIIKEESARAGNRMRRALREAEVDRIEKLRAAAYSTTRTKGPFNLFHRRAIMADCEHEPDSPGISEERALRRGHYSHFPLDMFPAEIMVAKQTTLGSRIPW